MYDVECYDVWPDLFTVALVVHTQACWTRGEKDYTFDSYAITVRKDELELHTGSLYSDGKSYHSSSAHTTEPSHEVPPDVSSSSVSSFRGSKLN